MTKRIYQLYLELLKKHGDPRIYWPGWCNRQKTLHHREEIVIGAILTQRTNWQNVEMALTNLADRQILSIKGIYELANGSRTAATNFSVATSANNIEVLAQLIRPTGFYRQKAKRLFGFCRMVIEEYGGLKGLMKETTAVVREKLLSLWGIGPETADSILLYGLDKPSFVIDEYTRRFLERRGMLKTSDYDSLKEFFEKNLPLNFRLYQDFHALIVVSEGI